MNNQNNGSNPNSNENSGESKLDRWLHQTLQSGGQPEGQKIVHESAPTNKDSHQNQNQRPKEKKGFFSRRQDKKQPNAAPAPHRQQSSPGGQRPPQSSARPPQPPARPSQPSAGTSGPSAPATAGPRQGGGRTRPQGRRSGGRQNQGRALFQGFKATRQATGHSNVRPAPMPTPMLGNQKYHGKLRCIAIGGLDEVGKNCMVLEYGNDIIIIDMGYQFPDADLLGVDYIIPDLSYLEGKEDRIRGIIFTHGHLDHIGATSYIIPKLNYPPMYGAQLTMSLIQKQMEEFKITNQARVNVIKDTDVLQLGAFNVSFFNVNHSIPDSMGVLVKSPAGNIVHTGDFKFDFTPHGNQRPADFAKISTYAQQDVAALFIDSTNALSPGHTITEAKVSESLDKVVRDTQGRLIIASFASQIGRLQDIVNIAKKYGRNIILSGRSLVDNFTIAGKMGYLNVPQGLVHEIHKAKKMPDEKTLILTTGSQGEDMSALSRMALEEHPVIKIKKGDTVVFSSSSIPGNEKAITTVVNNLARLGANIINNQIMDIHTSGHANQEDLKLMMTLVKAKAVVPIHGEYFMRVGNASLAKSLGYSDEQSIIIENGGIIEVENGVARPSKEKLETKYILIDGLGVGDIGAQVIMDRQQLAENGVLVILIPADPGSKKLKGNVEVISRGFIYMKQSEALIQEIAKMAGEKYNQFITKQPGAKHSDIKKYLRESLDRFVHDKIERQPLILPIVVEK